MSCTCQHVQKLVGVSILFFCIALGIGSRIRNLRRTSDETRSSFFDCSSEGVLGVTTSLVGTLMVAETIKLICETGQLLTNKLLVCDALNGATEILYTKKSEKCFANNKIVENQNVTKCFGGNVRSKAQNVTKYLKTSQNLSQNVTRCHTNILK